ncbi:MAG: DUF72 domain-containing protein [Chloroflexota bacterium]|nr:DUF72 domain-containing protein [Chloroflexota bacterium]
MASDARMAQVRIGCSGWQYRHWAGEFYPADLPQKRWLEHYARTFDTVEVNNSFYRLPPRTVFVAWRRRSPDGFSFAVKASRYLTHVKRLKDPTEPIDRLWQSATGLEHKLGPMLYQLPPRWHRDVGRLEAFLAAVPRGPLQAVEFRDPSWYADETYEVLERHAVAMCVHDMSGSASPLRFVGPFVYVRFHGSGARYGGRYPDRVLDEWADRLGRERETDRDVFAYFNNDVGGHAPRDAVRLRSRLVDG